MSDRRKIGLTDPDEIIREFQKRQKRLIVTGLVSFFLMVPVVMKVRTINPVYSAVVLAVFALAFFGYYVWTFRCPACGTRVQQRRRMLQMPIRCGRCGVLLDPHSAA